MEIKTALSQYVEAIAGTRPELRPVPPSSANLPLYLAEAYDLYETDLFDRTIPLALARKDSHSAISELVEDWRNLTKNMGSPVAMVLYRLQSFERKRLVEKRVPFIVPQRQMFLPMCLVDMREYFPGNIVDAPVKMRWEAQVIILRHLLFRDMTERPLCHIATQLGYFPISVSSSVSQLESLDLCHTVSKGRTKVVQFDGLRETLWKRVLPYLRSPVKKRYFVRWTGPVEKTGLRSGLSALADLTTLAPESLDVWAVENRAVRKLLTEGRISLCPDREEADGILEGWAYRPGLLSDRETVDPLSLFLGMQTERDDRVRIALDSLMEKII
jgi:hypothetical protein